MTLDSTKANRQAGQAGRGSLKDLQNLLRDLVTEVAKLTDAEQTFIDDLTATAAEINAAADISARTVDATAATLAVTSATHNGKTITLNRAAGITATLPAATGSGARFRFFVGTTVTTNAYIIQVANSTDVIQGVLGVATDAAGVNIPTAATSDTITMSGSTTGGVIGSWLEIEDVAAGFFSVNGALVSTGVEATPFSAAV